MIRGVLFDLGETLIRHDPPAEVQQRILADKGISKEIGKIEKAMKDAEIEFNTLHKTMNGMDIDSFYIDYDSMVLQMLGIDDRKLAEHVHHVWFDTVKLEAYDDAETVVSRLSAMGIRTGIVSNGYEEEVGYILDRVGLAKNLFEIIVGHETVGVPKPDPRPFHHGAGSMGLTPEEVLFVGDSYENDYLGSQAVGMKPVLILRGRQPPAEAPDDITKIQTLDELMNLVQ